MIRAVIALCLASSLSCSVLYVKRPQSRSPGEYPVCSRNPAASILDLVLAAGAFAIVREERENNNEFDNEDDSETYAIIGGVFVASAIYGIIMSVRCHRLKSRFRAPEPYRGFAAVAEPKVEPDAGASVDAGVDAGVAADAGPPPDASPALKGGP